MKNPWTKKNPFMSMWLSGANAVLGRVRGQGAAAVKRETTAATTRGIGSVLNFWTKAGAAAVTPPATATTPVKAKKSAMATSTAGASAATKKAVGRKVAAKKTAAARARKKRR